MTINQQKKCNNCSSSSAVGLAQTRGDGEKKPMDFLSLKRTCYSGNVFSALIDAKTHSTLRAKTSWTQTRVYQLKSSKNDSSSKKSVTSTRRKEST